MHSLVACIGTYGEGPGKGIWQLAIDRGTGACAPAERVIDSVNASFLALHPSRRMIYAVNESRMFNGAPSGSLSAFSVDESGRFGLVNQLASQGQLPCHVIVTPDAGHLLFTNYLGPHTGVARLGAGGRIEAIVALERHEGHGPHPGRQSAAHPHSVALDPTGTRAFASDLGTDRIVAYDFDPRVGQLRFRPDRTIATKPGSGPRSLVFHPHGHFAYAICELDSTIVSFAYDIRVGLLSVLQVNSTHPGDFDGENTGAGVEVHPSGRFLYASNRGHDSIGVFRIDGKTGHLTQIDIVGSGGRTPRHFAIDSSGEFLVVANQGSSEVTVFRIGCGRGELNRVGATSIPTPACVLML
jgi:6-phosphogluconolactonase